MNSQTIEELRKAIRRVRRRRNLILHVQHISWSLAILAAMFMFFGILEMNLALPRSASMLFFCVLGGLAAALGWRYARAVRRFERDDRRLAHAIDERTPSLEQRLLTSMDTWEKQGTDSPSQLVESLWLDTLAHVDSRSVQQVYSPRPAWIAAGSAFLVVCLVVGALWDSTRFSGAARRVAWPWFDPGCNSAAVGTLHDYTRGYSHTSRQRRSHHGGLGKCQVRKRLCLPSRKTPLNGKRLPMMIDEATHDYLYYLPGVTHDISYYVGSGDDRSSQYRIEVFDLIGVETINVDYFYPEYTGIEDKTEKNSGDIIAPEGTRVELHIAFNGTHPEECPEV